MNKLRMEIRPQVDDAGHVKLTAAAQAQLDRIEAHLLELRALIEKLTERTNG